MSYEFRGDVQIGKDLTAGGSIQAFGTGGVIVGKDNPGGTPNIAGSIKLWSAGDNTFYTSLTAATQTANATYTLPTAMPAVSGYVLSCTNVGVMSWIAATSSFTFSTGLTDNSSTITSDISTGKAGGQTIYGGTLTTQGLTIRANIADLTTGSVAIATSTASTSTTTGALTVAGGIGVAGTINTGALIVNYNPGQDITVPTGTTMIAPNATGSWTITVSAGATLWCYHGVTGLTITGPGDLIG